MGEQALKEDRLLDKAYGCLAGVVIGDAMGMPTTFYTPEQIRKTFGYVTSFLDAPPGHPVHSGMKAGQITDDTEITLIVAKVIIDSGGVTPENVASHLVKWATDKGVLKTQAIGPSTRRALEKLLSGTSPLESGVFGTTNGASMRISPVGILNAGRPASAVEDVVKTCLPTHGTNVAISAASAIACAIAEGMKEGPSVKSVIEVAKTGSRLGAAQGLVYPAASVEKRINLALEFVGKSREIREAALLLYDYIGAGVESNEAVPTAIGLFASAHGDPMEAITAAVNVGGDADTIASIVGGVAGAYQGINAFPERLVREVETVNNLHLKEVATKLVKAAYLRKAKR